jgi:hypothetical protein
MILAWGTASVAALARPKWFDLEIGEVRSRKASLAFSDSILHLAGMDITKRGHHARPASPGGRTAGWGIRSDGLYDPRSSSAASIAAQQAVQIPLPQASGGAGAAACTTAACLGLDFLIIASWARFPDRDLPESDPNAYVSLVNHAFTLLRQQPVAITFEI